MTTITATAARTVQAARALDATTDRDGFLTVAELATVTGKTARRLRRDFRKAGNEVGHGGVWAIAVTDAGLFV